jgi:hypothetical protein
MKKMSVSAVKVWMSEQDNVTLMELCEFLGKCIDVNTREMKKLARKTFKVGSKVAFRSSLTGTDVTGHIMTMGDNEAAVNCAGDIYSVPLVMLRKAV